MAWLTIHILYPFQGGGMFGDGATSTWYPGLLGEHTPTDMRVLVYKEQNAFVISGSWCHNRLWSGLRCRRWSFGDRPVDSPLPSAGEGPKGRLDKITSLLSSLHRDWTSLSSLLSAKNRSDASKGEKLELEGNSVGSKIDDAFWSQGTADWSDDNPVSAKSRSFSLDPVESKSKADAIIEKIMNRAWKRHENMTEDKKREKFFHQVSFSENEWQ